MTTLVTRRQYTYGLVATMAMLAGGCATMSPSEERRLGQEAAEEVEQMVGLVRDPKLVGYVRQVGGRLAQAAQRPDITWRFNVADDPEANAFALPGGWVYVTRGLLALLNSEDELERFAEAVELLAAHTPETLPPRRTLTILADR